MTKRDSNTIISMPAPQPLEVKAAKTRPTSTGVVRAFNTRLSQTSCRIALRKDVGAGVAESLLRYVKDFGQGKGTALVENGLIWLELQFHEDRDMLKSQFRDLFTCPEA